MTRLVWHAGANLHDQGVDRGVLYLGEAPGVAWSGLVSINEKANSAVSSSVYFDGERRVLQEVSEFGATIEAFTYPDEFSTFTGDDEFYVDTQPRPRFNLSYRTLREPGYLIHLVYNAMVTPAPRSHKTLGGPIDLSTFVWELQATSVDISQAKPSAHLVVETLDAPEEAVVALEELLYGTDTSDATFPTIEQVMAIFGVDATIVITDNGDGTWTAEGPDSMISMLDPDTFQITQPDAVYIHKDVYTIATH